MYLVHLFRFIYLLLFSHSKVVVSNVASASSDPPQTPNSTSAGTNNSDSDSDSESDGDDDEQALVREKMKADGALVEYNEHEESVYRCVWANNDPWTFASLSLDGRFLINHIPSKVKFSILL
eukprot:m.85502 g.85502  ORF g.85502 m.85502 type:complete len:122 (-) comp12192_c0_seq3:180-545(-)